MGKKVLFLDSVEKGDGSYNVTYGTDDINAIVRSLTGAGVSIFPSGETFNVSDLNSITEAMVSAGVSFDGLRVSLSNGKIHIASGIGFFENGAIITVDADGAELEYKVSENVYVYAEYDKTLNICDFRTSEVAPSEAEGVFRLMLAVIEADGTVNDRRTIAVSKVASMGKNLFREIVIKEDDGEFTDWYKEGTIIYEEFFDINKINSFNRIFCFVRAYTNDDYYWRYSFEDLAYVYENPGLGITLYSHPSSSTSYQRDALSVRLVDGKFQFYVPVSSTSKPNRMRFRYLRVAFC